MTRDDNHAISNARGWSETISQLVAALECDYERLEELRDEKAALLAEVGDKHSDFDTAEMRKAREELTEWLRENGEELRDLEEIVSAHDANYPFKDADDARERIMESALSVQVRSGWCDPGADISAEEFEILLTTGGPALRIMGELDEHCQPRRAWLQYQDWGTPWTDFVGSEAPDRDTLLTFCQQFYFGGRQ